MLTTPTRLICIFCVSTIAATILMYLNLKVTFPPDIPGRLVQYHYLSKALAYLVIVLFLQCAVIASLLLQIKNRRANIE